jgi:hypothetical protein
MENTVCHFTGNFAWLQTVYRFTPLKSAMQSGITCSCSMCCTFNWGFNYLISRKGWKVLFHHVVVNIRHGTKNFQKSSNHNKILHATVQNLDAQAIWQLMRHWYHIFYSPVFKMMHISTFVFQTQITSTNIHCILKMCRWNLRYIVILHAKTPDHSNLNIM